jgi:hypothetical protein
VGRLLPTLLLLLLGVALPTQTLAVDLFTELRTFPGVVLLPPADLTPFDGLQPWRVELNRPLPTSTAPPHGRYLVQYRQPSGNDISSNLASAQVGGTIGGGEFDDRLQTLAMLSYKRCPADASYCTENVGGQDGAALASELFRGLTVGVSPAVAEHVICCAGHYWSVTWYDPGRDMTYEIVLVGSAADRYADAINQSNLDAATQIAEMAARLMPLQ